MVTFSICYLTFKLSDFDSYLPFQNEIEPMKYYKMKKGPESPAPNGALKLKIGNNLWNYSTYTDTNVHTIILILEIY